jgi:hemerythrin-like metal-binding protein
MKTRRIVTNVSRREKGMGERIAWGEELKVGVHIIDEEHRRLVGMINRLDEANRGKECLEEILNELEDYINKHFVVEEEMMTVYDFPEAQSHFKAHHDFRKRIHSLRESFKDGELDLPKSLMDFLVNWLKSHILGTDRVLAEFLQEKGMP